MDPVPTSFSVTVRENDGLAVVSLRGELDLASASELESAVLPHVREGGHAVLDLRHLEFMDSTGVRVIVASHQAASEGGGRLTVVRAAPGTPVQRVLEISGLEEMLEVVDEPQ